MNEKIFKYLDNQLNEVEKAAFEAELLNNPDLNAQVKKYKELLSAVKFDAANEPLPGYFDNVVPQFRQKLEIKKAPRFSVKYAFAAFSLVFIVSVGLLLFNTFNPGNSQNVEAISGEMTGEEIADVIKTIENESTSGEVTAYTEVEIDENQVDELIYDEIQISEETVDVNLTTYEFSEMIASANETEADAIYSELLNKDFLGKDN